MQTEAPMCPKCGGPMQRKKAARGPNAGGEFWGCRSYPKCRGTRDAEVNDRPLNLPRPLVVGASSKARRLIYFEGSAAPRSAVAVLVPGLPRPLWRSLSHWFAEWPVQSGVIQLPPPPPWLAVAGKILRRGRLLPLSRGVESRIGRVLGTTDSVTEEEWLTAARELARLLPEPIEPIDTFESPAEREFYQAVLPSLAPSRVRSAFKMQVRIGSLTGDRADSEAAQRVDFLLAHPNVPPVVVEIDGSQHEQERAADAARDGILRQHGIEVLRIPAADVFAGAGPAIDRLGSILRALVPTRFEDLSPAAKWLLAAKRVIQCQLTLLRAFEEGVLQVGDNEPIRAAFMLDPALGGPLGTAIVEAAIEDFNLLLHDTAAALGLDSTPRVIEAAPSEAALCLSLGAEPAIQGVPCVTARDAYMPASPEQIVPRSTRYSATRVDREACERLLNRIFGYEEFREGQFEAIERAVMGLDSMVLLPTGSGKSAAFQLASLLRPGVGIVVDPIVSLIEDQLVNLSYHGIDRAARIDSTIDTKEREAVLELLARGQYWFCYVAPERFQSAPFRESLRGLTTNAPVSLVAVDEAHCVSEWGHDFRPAYLNLARVARDYCASSGTPPPIMALTGTASTSVLKDVQRELGIPDFEAVIVPKTFDRKELRYETIPCRSGEKIARLTAVLSGLPGTFGATPEEFFAPRGAQTASGIVFCPWVNGDYGVVRVSEALSAHLRIPVPFYASTPPKGARPDDWRPTLRRTAEGFKRNRFPVMAATKAFGMGIDKPNVRYTVHFSLPPSIEAFYQEAGRAGRDGLPARCVVLYSDDVLDRTKKLLNPAETDLDDVHQAVRIGDREKDDDITRALWFHSQAFRGRQEDSDAVTEVVHALGPLDQIDTKSLPFDGLGAAKRDERARARDADDEMKRRERAIHRLVVVGAVSDYTVDYSKRSFRVIIPGRSKEGILQHLYDYVAAYQRPRASKELETAKRHTGLAHDDFVLAVCRQLIGFVYDVIERARRQALSEMLQICRTDDGETFRTALLQYLERSRFAESIEYLLNADDAGLSLVPDIIEELRSTLDAHELRGECARELESYPDQPCLRLLRAIAEAASQRPDVSVIEQNAAAAIRDGVAKYGLDEEQMLDTVLMGAESLLDTRPGLAHRLLSGAVMGAPDPRRATRYLLRRVRPGLANPLLTLLIQSTTKRAREVVEAVRG